MKVPKFMVRIYSEKDVVSQEILFLTQIWPKFRNLVVWQEITPLKLSNKAHCVRGSV